MQKVFMELMPMMKYKKQNALLPNNKIRCITFLLHRINYRFIVSLGFKRPGFEFQFFHRLPSVTFEQGSCSLEL